MVTWWIQSITRGIIVCLMVYLVVSGIVLIFVGLTILPREGRLAIIRLPGDVTIEGPVGMIMILAGVAVGGLGFVNPWSEPAIPVPKGTIASPAENATVEQHIIASGRQEAIPVGTLTFVLLKVANLDKYFPSHVEALPDGTWTAEVTVGGDEGLCAQYQLTFVMASGPGAAKLRDYMRSNKADGVETSELLGDFGITILDVVNLTRASVLVANPLGGQLVQVEKCDGATGDRDLNQFCRSKGFPDGVGLVLGDNGGAYNNWQCRSSTTPINLVDACIYAYPDRHVITAVPNNANDPNTWRCYVEPRLVK